MSSGADGLTREVARQLRAMLAEPVTQQKLDAALRLLGKWKAQGLSERLQAQDGDTIGFGPFAGMIFDIRASEGGEAPRRLGCYEASLSPVIEAIVSRGYLDVVDVGCAEGYYAVGLALRMTGSIVHAFDTNPTARERCTALGTANGVSARLRVGGTLTHARLDTLARAGAMILCDIEGGEETLLDPGLAPGLARADILVEVHEGMHPGLCERLTRRFGPTHKVQRIDRQITDAALPAWAEDLSDMDRLILLWEWRSAPTPWLWMEAHQSSPDKKNTKG